MALQGGRKAALFVRWAPLRLDATNTDNCSACKRPTQRLATEQIPNDFGCFELCATNYTPAPRGIGVTPTIEDEHLLLCVYTLDVFIF